MKTNVVQLHNISPEEFKSELISDFQRILSEFAKGFDDKKYPKYLTRKDVSKLLGVSLVTIHEWCKKGILKPKRIGTRVRFDLADIEEILES